MLFLKNSLIYKIWSILVNAFKESKLMKASIKTKDIYNSSFLSKAINWYLDKKPYYENALTTRFFVKLMGLLDKLLGFFHKLFAPLFKGSSVVKEAFNIPSLKFKEAVSMLSILILAVNLGFCLGKVLKGEHFAPLIPTATNVFAFFLFILARHDSWLKESFVYKKVLFFIKKISI